MVISVLIEINIGKREKTFDYIVPKNLEKYIKKGIRVKVPFGKKIYEGFVIDIKKTSNYNLKTIIDIIDKEPILNDELLNLGKKIAYDNVCNLISVYQSMLPRGLKASTKTSIKVKKIAYIKLLNTNCEVKGKKQIELIKLLKKKKTGFKK
jgi:primosomal protein N' (replication factor Y)